MSNKRGSFFKRTLAASLLAVLPVSVAGCVTTASSSTPTSQTSSEGEIDVNGYEFSVVSLWGTNTYFNPQKGESAKQDYYYERLRDIEKEYGCTIKYTGYSGEDLNQSIISSAMAGDKFADFILLDYPRFVSLRASDLLMPMSRMKYIDLEDTKWSPSAIRVASFNNEVYGIETSSSLGSVMFFNATLLKEKNVTSPYELYKQGKWTWEEFEKLAKAMTIDTDGDHIPDIYGIGTVQWAALQMEIPFLYSNGASEIKPDNGTYRYSMLDADAQEALNFVKGLYDQKLVYPSMPTTNEGGAAMFKARKVAFMFHQFGFTNSIKDDMEDDYGMVPFPKGPSASDYVSMHSQYPVYVATIGTSEPDKSSFIFNLCMEPLAKTGDETVDDPDYFTRTNSLRDDEDAFQIFKDLSDKVTPLQGMGIVTLSNLTPAIYACTRDGSNSPKASMEAIENKIQLQIEDFFKKSKSE